MKKNILVLALTALMTVSMTACSATVETESKTESGTKGAISVIAREEGSGTRGAFVELIGVVDEDENDITTLNAEITNSTSVMLTTVAGNKNAIGYVSLGSLTNDVKAVNVDGVTASAHNVKDGSYKVARPFLVAYKEENLSDLAKDYLSFILSSEGQKIIEDKGYIPAVEGSEYAGGNLSGKLVLAGSTSVAPVMEVIADKYKEINPNVDIEIQQTGSGAGITSAIEGVCDFGMSSRELKDSEKEELTDTQIAVDGIAVVVNNQNEIEELTSEQIKEIYLGNITDWSEVQK